MARLVSGNRGGGAAGLSLSPVQIGAGATGAVATLRTSLSGALTFSKLSGASAIAIASTGAVSLSAALGSGGSASVTARVQNATGDAIERTVTLSAAAGGGSPTPSPTPTPGATLSMPTLQAKRAAGQRAVLGVIGDSTTAGWGGAAITGTGSGADAGGTGFAVANSWPAQLAALLTAAGAPARADAWFSHYSTYGGRDAAYLNTSNGGRVSVGSGWAATSFSSVGGDIADCGDATTILYTPEVAADSFDLLVTGSTIAGYMGDLVVSDASGTLATISEATLTGGAAAVTAGGYAARRVTVTRATASTDPITLARGSDTVWVIGIIPYDSTSPRLELLNLGWPSSSCSDTLNWNDATYGWSPFNALQVVGADAWIIDLGLNDSARGASSSTFQTGLNALATRAKALGDLALAKPNTATGGGYGLSSAHLTAIDSVRSSLSLRPVLDFNAITLATADRYDAVHLAKPGYAKLAAAAKTYLVG